MAEWTFCPICGSKLQPDDTGCRACGSALPDATTVASGEQPVPPGEDFQLARLTEELREALAPNLQLLKPLGQGGMGTVFLARDPALKRLVVVKVLSPQLAYDPKARRRFEREAESAAAVQHPNVVSVFQVGELPESGTSYFVMQYVEGKTLAEAFPEGTVVPVPRAKRIIGEIASALAAAHARGLVHRDIKPSNIMLEDESDRVIVLDFGISAAVSTERALQAGTKLTEAGFSVGTPQYMSPEQAAGEQVTEKSDVYSLGLVAFELLAGRPVFDEASPMALAAAHINKDPSKVAEVRSDVEPQIAGLVDRCLSKRPEDRPRSVEIQAALGASHKIVEWPPPGLENLRRRGRGLKVALWWAAVAGLLFALNLMLQPGTASASWVVGDEGVWGAVDRAIRGPTSMSEWVGATAAGSDPSRGADYYRELANRGLAASLWLLVVLMTFLFWSGTVVNVGFRAISTGAEAVWGVAAGYPIGQLTRVAVQGHIDTGSLLAGVDRFGTLSRDQRVRVLRARDITEWLAVAGASVLASAPLLWFWLELIVQFPATGASRVAGGFIWIPAAVALVAVAARRASESRLVGSTSPHRRLLRERSIPAEEVVGGWLASAGAERRKHTRPFQQMLQRRLVVWSVSASLVVVSGLLLYVASIAGILLFKSTSRLAAEQGVAQAWWTVEQAEGDALFQNVQSMLGRVAAVGSPPVLAPDVSALQSLDQEFSALEAWADSTRLAYGARILSSTGGQWAGVATRVARGDPAPPAWDSIVPLAGSERLDPFIENYRRVALGARLPPFSLIRRSSRTLEDYPSLRFARWSRTPILRGWTALAERDFEGAQTAAREVLAFSDRLSMNGSSWLGHSFATSDAADLLNAVADLTGDSALKSEATAVSAAVWDYQGFMLGLWSARGPFWADPAESPLREVLKHAQVPTPVRLSALAGVVTGLCYSPREVLFGVAESRLQMLDTVALAVADIPDIEQQLDHYRFLLFTLDRNPEKVSNWQDPGVAFLLPQALRRASHRLWWCDNYP